MTIIQSDIKVKALLFGNSDESKKEHIYFFCPVSASILLEL
jgi:hypothetical protein